MSTLRQEISNILGFTIAPDGWDKAFGELDKDGRIFKKQIISIVLALIKRVEKLEDDK